MDFSIFRLRFITPLHIGNVRSDYTKSETIIHSDTLYSSIFEAWSVLGKENLIAEQTGNLQFTVSSLFPYTVDKNVKFVYFFPKPLNLVANQTTVVNLKEIKRIEFIDQEFLERYRNEGLNYDYSESVKGNFLSDKLIRSDFIQSEIYPRVSIPRDKGEAMPYYVERIFFTEGSGLYFIAQFKNEQVKNNVISALKYLGDEGFGTDRHVGNGMFEFDEDTISFTEINSSSHAMNLSLYCPENDSVKTILDDDYTAYELVTRGGWITTPMFNSLRKKYVRMFREGSILKINKYIDGKVVDVSPDKNLLPENLKNINPIYRIGKSLFLTVKI
mgnify:FL=1